MSMVLQGGPFMAPIPGLHLLTVEQYHAMIADGVLTEGDRVELLEGYLVNKMPHDPFHDGTVQKINRRLTKVLPDGWEVRVQMSTTLRTSEPEPDLAVVREDSDEYLGRHPGPDDYGVIIEVANSSLDTDRIDKVRIYGKSGIPVYWVVEVVNRVIEVHVSPTGASAKPGYGHCTVYTMADSVPFDLAGTRVDLIPVNELIK